MALVQAELLPAPAVLEDKAFRDKSVGLMAAVQAEINGQPLLETQAETAQFELFGPVVLANFHLQM
jgi:hypothetical protein